MSISAADTPLGQVLRDANGVRLEFVRHYNAPIADVWAAVTDSGRTARWIGTWSGDPATGVVQLTMSAAEENAPTGDVRIVECTEPTRLAVIMESPEGEWPVSVELAERDGVTTMRFTHELGEPYDASSVGPGWQFYLDRLGAVIDDTEIPGDFDAYYPALASSYAIG